MMAKRRRTTVRKAEISGRVRAADPFELIRWLAQSQPDPRKALAELVQNSIDAGARHIRITRQRDRGKVLLRVLDDGEGVIPELPRTEALKYVATHIGHSRKSNLTPEQRRELMLVGKYGIGLLGFWAIGKTLEMRTHVPGQPPYVLRMFENSPRYEIERLRGRLALDQRWTELIVRDLHPAAFSALTARRMNEFLASELRGQLLSRDIEVIVHDRIARGRAPKVLTVRPVRFSGERLDLPDSIAIEGYSPLRVELYLVADGRGRVTVSSGGTSVYDDLASFESHDFAREPWTSGRIGGVIEFADFNVSPGTRRGVIPDEAAMAFARAVSELEAAVNECIAAADARAAAEIEASLLRRLERAFRDVPRLAPEYDFFAVRSSTMAEKQGGGTGNGKQAGGEGGELPEGAELPPGEEFAGEADEGTDPLLVPGPLAQLVIVPNETRVERLGRRPLRVQGRDAAGTIVREGFEVQWSVAEGLGHVEPAHGKHAVFLASPFPGTVKIRASVQASPSPIEAEAVIEVVEELGTDSTSRTGIPEPVFVEEPGAPWRSRMRESVWEVNSAHPDFRAACETARRKLRYLSALLAKEIVMHSFPSPQIGSTLERMVEVLTIVEKRLEAK